MRVSKSHRELASALFDLMQLVWDAEQWDVVVREKSKEETCGVTLKSENLVVVYKHPHLGGHKGPMAQTLLHEQLHAVFEDVRVDQAEAEEAYVCQIETFLWQGLDRERRGRLEFLLKPRKKERP